MQSTILYEYCTLFPSLGFIPLGFTSKLLMRHIHDDDHSRGSVVNEQFYLHVLNDHIETHSFKVHEFSLLYPHSLCNYLKYSL